MSNRYQIEIQPDVSPDVSSIWIAYGDLSEDKTTAIREALRALKMVPGIEKVRVMLRGREVFRKGKG